MNKSPIAVVGAGVAGISCAVRLAKRGIPVLLFEQSDRPGGRATSRHDSDFGTDLDSGFHLTIGAYDSFFETLDIIGARDLYGAPEPPDFEFAGRDGERKRFSYGRAPGKAGALTGFLRFGGLSLKSKLRAALFVSRLNSKKLDSYYCSALDLLREQGQTDESITAFWRPLIVSALNTEPEEASAQVFLTVARRGFFAGGKAGFTVYQKAPFLKMFSQIDEFLERNNSRAFYRKAIVGVNIDDGAVSSVTTKSGVDYPVSGLVYCGAPKGLQGLLSADFSKEFEQYSRLEYSPIVSAYLMTDRPVLKRKAYAFIDSPVHWIFNLGAIGLSENVLAVTVSAARDLFSAPAEKAMEIISNEAFSRLPELKTVNVIKSKILKEARATLKATAENEALRPGTECSIKGLYLAGDAVQTGLPATLESASLSGEIAARMSASYYLGRNL